MNDRRIGLGFDVHPRDEARPLVLGGVRFDGEPGLGGHSDADVVCHALADALLGAASLGDLGRLFPDTDPSLAGAAGMDLLGRVMVLLGEAGFTPEACDLVVIAARPAIAPRAPAMRENLASVLGVSADRVSVKATRPEGLGLVGDGAGCLALAVVAAG